MVVCIISGWICYAEKTHGSFILPYVSNTKSPQQIMGSLVKYRFAKSISKRSVVPYVEGSSLSSGHHFFAPPPPPRPIRVFYLVTVYLKVM